MPRTAHRNTILTTVRLADLSNTEPTPLGGGYTPSEITQFRRRISRWNQSELRRDRGMPRFGVSVDSDTGVVTLRPNGHRAGTPYSNRAWIHAAASLLPGQALEVRIPRDTPNLAAGRNAIAVWNRRYPEQRLCTCVLPEYPDALVVHRPGVRPADLSEGIVEVLPYTPLPYAAAPPSPPAVNPRDTAEQAAAAFRARVQAAEQRVQR